MQHKVRHDCDIMNFPASSSFDEFIMNFCSNELNSSNSNESKLDETPVEQQSTKPAASASLDELLNLRPKSFVPSALGKLPLQVVRTLKPTTAYVSLSNKPSADQTVTPKNVNVQTSSVLMPVKKVPAQPAKPIVPVAPKSFSGILPMSKKMVIYKVESDDLKDTSEKPTSIFNFFNSSYGHLSNFILIIGPFFSLKKSSNDIYSLNQKRFYDEKAWNFVVLGYYHVLGNFLCFYFL